MTPDLSPDPRNAMKTVRTYSSFGPQGTTFPDVPARNIIAGPRYTALEFRESYYRCSQHDAKIYDFDGRLINSGGVAVASEKPAFRVPLKMRRPVVPVRLGKIIVDAFTNLIFGEGRFPAIRVDGDPDTQDFYRALSEFGKLPVKMLEARALGGSCGTVGLSWSYDEGLPQFQVHNAKNLFVHAWHDRTKCIPAHVTEVYPFYKVQWDGKEMAQVYYWYRRDWTPDADIAFKEVLWQKGEEPAWAIDDSASIKHDDGECHFAWIQNTPNSESNDGFPDYDGLFDQLDAIDVLSSVVHRGATLNLDPTLILKMDPDEVGKMGLRKGSDDALVVGTEGDASYMELTGSSITVGMSLLDHQRKQILETAQCVIPDPDQVTAQGTSSVAMKMMYARMTARGDSIREQYAEAMTRALKSMRMAAVNASKVTVSVLDEATGEETPGEIGLALPPRIERETDPETGEETTKEIPRDPGEGGVLTFAWPPYFPPTPADQQAIVTNLSTATGAVAFLSVETATELAAQAFGFDLATEQKRMSAQADKAAAEQAAMFPPVTNEQDPAAKGDDESPTDPRGSVGAKPPPFGGKPKPPAFGGKPKPAFGAKPPPFGDKPGGGKPPFGGGPKKFGR